MICLVETSYFFDPFKNHINYSITCMKHVMIIFQTEYQMNIHEKKVFQLPSFVFDMGI
jgi:hypothetical protein